MKQITGALNGLLGHVNLRLSRASSIHGLLSELERRQEQLDEALASLEREKVRREEERLLHMSQSRWRTDEPDAGLTWGVPMQGDAFVQFVLAHMTLTEASTIVEIGPGYGRILKSLLKSRAPFRQYIGLELSPARVKRLRDQFTDPRIEFREADVLGVVELNAVADLTVSSAVFEHLYPDFDGALGTISNFTRTGGSVAIDFIRHDADLDHSTAWFDENTYMRTYSIHELKRLFEKSGLVPQQMARISFGEDILNREIARTVVFATKGDVAGPSLDSIAVAGQATSSVAPFDAFVRRERSTYDAAALDPPEKPEFRTGFGGFWTDLNSADAILAGKVATGALLPSEAKLVDAWRRDGFVILRGAIDGPAIDRALADFERAYDGALQLKMSFWDDKGFHIKDASREHLRKKDAKLLDIHEVSEPIQHILFAEPINRFLQILFERPALAFQSLGFYYGSQQELHQDTAFVRVSSPMEFVASWIALEDIVPGSGELEYYPGSHAIPFHLFGGSRLWVRYDDPEVLTFSEKLHANARNAGLEKQRFVPRKGDVLIWAAGLMHGGSPVQEPARTRKSLVTHYCPAEQQPMFAYKGGREKRKSVNGNYLIAERWD